MKRKGRGIQRDPEKWLRLYVPATKLERWRALDKWPAASPFLCRRFLPDLPDLSYWVISGQHHDYDRMRIAFGKNSTNKKLWDKEKKEAEEKYKEFTRTLGGHVPKRFRIELPNLPSAMRTNLGIKYDHFEDVYYLDARDTRKEKIRVFREKYGISKDVKK